MTLGTVFLATVLSCHLPISINNNLLSLISDNCYPSTTSTIIANATSLERFCTLSLKLASNLSLLFNQFNDSTPQNSSDPDNVVNYKYYDIDENKKIKIINRNKFLCKIFHINARSLSKKFDDLEHLLQYTNKSLDIIAVSETGITKAMSQLCDINLKNYSIGPTPTESTASGNFTL